LFGIIGVVFYLFHIIFGRIFYPEYNPFSQAVSDLTASNSPSKEIASIFSFIYGMFSVIFSMGFFVYFKRRINKFITTGSFIFFMMTIISFFGYTFFPLSEAGFAGTFPDIMHIVVTIFVVLFTIVSIIFYGIGFLMTSNHKFIGKISVVTLVLLIIGAILLNILPNEYFGVPQRINVYSTIIYIGVLSFWMNKYIRNNEEKQTST
jgi:hypothetical membrane protein